MADRRSQEVVLVRHGETDWSAHLRHEGRTTIDIRREVPDWTIWRYGATNGESPDEVASRADRIVAEVRGADGDVLISSHGHVLRVLAARWLGLGPREGRLFALDTASISVLGYERETSVIRIWHQPVTE